MKVLQIIYSLTSGGAERFVVDLSNELVNQGHDVVLCVLRDDKQSNYGFYKPEISKKVSYINLKIPAGFRLSNVLILFRLIQKIKPHVVHCHLSLVNYIFPLTPFFPKIEFFQTIHGDSQKEKKSKTEFNIRRFFYKKFLVKPVTISPETSRSFKDYYNTAYFAEIYNGRARPEKSRLFDDVRKELQEIKQQGYTLFVHIGSCTPAKNQKMLVSVFNRLFESGVRVMLLVIGSGFDSPEGLNLRNMASGNIIFLGEKNNVSDYLINADAFCLSSSHEGMPVSLIEALACGCTPVCTPVGGIVNTIENGITGFLAKTVSGNDYYAALMDYLENKERVNREELYKLYLDRFAIEKCAQNYLSAYNHTTDVTGNEKISVTSYE